LSRVHFAGWLDRSDDSARGAIGGDQWACDAESADRGSAAGVPSVLASSASVG